MSGFLQRFGTLLSLTFVWASLIRQQVPSCFLSAFADNLSWSADNIHAHRAILDITLRWTAATDMDVDWRKSWNVSHVPAPV